MSANPIYDQTVRALAGHYAREAVRAGLAWAEPEPTPAPKARHKPRRTSATRLRILNESVIHYARTANA